MKKSIRYFARDGYPVKLVYNDEEKSYDAYRIDVLTGNIQFDSLYVGKALGYFYPPGSDLYFDEIEEEKYNEYVKKIQRRAKKKLPFYCIVDNKTIKVVLEKSRYTKNLLRVIYEFDELKKDFKRRNSYLEKVYGETDSSVKYISEGEFNKYIERFS